MPPFPSIRHFSVLVRQYSAEYCLTLRLSADNVSYGVKMIIKGSRHFVVVDPTSQEIITQDYEDEG